MRDPRLAFDFKTFSYPMKEKEEVIKIENMGEKKKRLNGKMERQT